MSMREGEKGAAVQTIHVIGLAGGHPDPGLLRIIAECRAIAGSRRLFDTVMEALDQRQKGIRHIPITPLDEMIRAVRKEAGRGPCAVLASGDPLFYGIGKRLIEALGRERLIFHPALSSVQLACSRLGISWHDAQIITLHGRDGRAAGFRILTSPLSIIFTDRTNSPNALATRLLDHLSALGHDELAGRIRVHVAEELGWPDERIGTYRLDEAASQGFSPLNIAIFRIPAGFLAKNRGLGLKEKEIGHLRGLITKDEIRAVTLHRLMPESRPEGLIFWDVGAGSGSVGLEMSRLYPTTCTYAVERSKELIEVVRENCRRLGILNVYPVLGEAPEALAALPSPDRVFIGGSGGRLAQIIEACSRRLRPGGVLVANAILKETASEAPGLMKEAGLRVDVVRIAADRMGSGRLNPITIIRGVKRAGA